MKKRIDTAGFRLDPDDKIRLQLEAAKRGLTVSSFIEKIINQHFARETGLSGEHDLTKYLDIAMEELVLSLADDGQISPDEAGRIMEPIIILEAKIYGLQDFTVGRATV